ncbi:efflux RND transporter permease subunit [Opitutales bacterium]|nr:efflux RND transporter permease subunit [Opitutales bacterium]MDB2681061.1 efflux RND transporter permease subunit [Opitutales bacterium]
MSVQKSFTDLFIKRPILAIVVNLAIVIVGLQAYFTLNVRQYPKNENAVITITTAYIGADAKLVRGFITTPIERAIAAADGIDYIESNSIQGVSTIQARLKLNYDGKTALSEISTKVDQVRGDLPPESEVPILTIETADSQIAASYLSFRSNILAANEVTDYLTRVVQPRLSAVVGVQKADILGAQNFAMRIWLKPDRLAGLSISPAQINQAIAANNYLSAVGQTKGQLITVNLTANTDLSTVDDFERLVIAERNGGLVRLSDVADVVLGAETYDADVRFSGEKAVFMGVWVLPNANTLDVMAGVRAELDRIKQGLPQGMQATIAYDSTEYIEDAISEVYHTLSETLLIVMVVIFLFLGSLRAVIVPVIAIPISLIGGFFLMQLLGFSLNLLTLLAIVLSVGLVVDDAIVVVENVERHLTEGKGRIEAALIAARELVGPVIATTLVLLAVYTPIALQGGLTGAYFMEFALTLTGAVVISTVVALTLSPMMSSRFLRANESERGFAGWITRQFEALKHRYSKLLSAALNSRPWIYTIWIALTVLAIPMFILSPPELAPTEDQGFLFGIVQTPSNSTLEQVSHYTQQMYDVYAETPEYDFTFQITNPMFGMGGMGLVPWSERDRSSVQITQDVQQRASVIPGINAFMLTPSALPGGGEMPVEFVLASTAETEQILAYAEQIKNKAMQSGKFMFLKIDVKLDSPQSEIVLDRDKIAAMGLSLQQVGQDLGAALGGAYVNRFSIDGRSYKVIPQLKRTSRLNPDQLNDIYTMGPGDRLIPLSSIATIVDSVQPRSLNRFQQLNSVKISGITNQTLDAALAYLEAEAASQLPAGFAFDYTGESRQLRKEGGNKVFLQTFGLAVIMVFLVLAAQFNSFRDPLILLLGSVPLAVFGASVFTFLKIPMPGVEGLTTGWTTTFNIYTQVGLVTLVGLIAKNGILIVEFANALQRQGLPKLEAVHQASLTRLRPILMTTAATILGHLPLTLVSGAGAAARNSIGLVLVGGLSIGTVFTLFIIPVIYVLIAAEHTGKIVKPISSENLPVA